MPNSRALPTNAHDDARTNADARRRGQGRRHPRAGALARARKRRYAGTEQVDAAQDHEENANAARRDDEPHLEAAHDALEEPDHAAAVEINGRTPELDFGATKDELANFDNDGQLMSIKDHCAVPPPEPRKPIIEPPTDVEALRRDYDARFSGLHAYGPTGATRLEELVEAALAASERAVAAYKAEKRAAHRSKSHRSCRARRPAPRCSRRRAACTSPAPSGRTPMLL